MITASWQSDQAIISPSFSLCVEVDGGDDCGDAIWPAVSRNGSSDTYSMSIIAPSISSQGSFFIKMKSDLGDYYTSPDFDLSQPTTPPEASGPNPLAIGIPLTMVGMALLGAVVFCLTRSKREKREAGGRTTGLNPSIQGSSSVFHAPLAAAAAKGGVLEAGGATFFNVSLSKTTTDLSNVEKAVCGAISAGSAAARPVPVRQEECRSSSTVGSKLPALDEERLTLVGEDERYTTPPPRTWQRRESDRYGRNRTWAMEKQLRRALEREADLHWELERRKLAWRKMNSSFPSHSRRMFEENDRRCFSMHSAPDLGPDRWASTSRSRPYALRQSSPEHVAGDLPSIDPPNYRSRDPSEELLSRAPGPRPPTAAASSKSGSYPSQVPPREDDDMHTSLSVKRQLKSARVRYTSLIYIDV
ncbi:hypothetical protein FRB90_001132 [Tulasnella sp. 427]|nr:hypothetical protein FRB90_001132 [Tulasnella sp. 427]